MSGQVARGDACGRWRFGVAVLAVLLFGPAVASAAIPPGSVELVPADVRGVGGCIPFANNTQFGFTGFVYRNVPAFRLPEGGRFAFDLGGLNDRDVRRNIYFAVASVNPSGAVGTSGVRALGWTQVASDTQVPESPRGNTVVGDYELVFTAEAAFDFPGGGLVVGFGGAPPGGYADPGCEPVVVHTRNSDPSGYFYSRFWNRADRSLDVLDTGHADGQFLGGVVIYPSDTEPPTTTATLDPVPDPDGWHTGPVTVTLTADDGATGSGVAELWYAVDDAEPVTADGDVVTFVIAEPGLHVVRYRSADGAGNVEPEGELQVRIARFVHIDVEPHRAQDVVRGAIVRVVVLSTDDFEAGELDRNRLTFGVTGAEESLVRCLPPVDVNRDGRPDLECLFSVSQAGLPPSPALAHLRAWTGGSRVVGHALVTGPAHPKGKK
jgi:hypothetical protein